MTPTPWSQSLSLRIAVSAFGTIFIGFGINAILRPLNALEPFELVSASATSDSVLVESLLAVYGVRDMFMGLALYVAAYYGHSQSLGWTSILASFVAYADGAICKYMIGKGEWNHWGYAPMLTAVGIVLLGALDPK